VGYLRFELESYVDSMRLYRRKGAAIIVAIAIARFSGEELSAFAIGLLSRISRL
jgi:hypothetical protein